MWDWTANFLYERRAAIMAAKWPFLVVALLALGLGWFAAKEFYGTGDRIVIIPAPERSEPSIPPPAPPRDEPRFPMPMLPGPDIEFTPAE